MKKIKLSVATLLIAGSSYGQAPKDSVKISKEDLQMILIDLDDILSWQHFDIEEAEVEQYQSDDLSTAFFDRESQEVITKAELQDIIEENDSVDDSLVAYQSV